MLLEEILAKITNPNPYGSVGSRYLPEKMAQLTEAEVVCLCTEAPRTLENLAWAAFNNQPAALNAISGKLEALTGEQVVSICTKAPNTLRNLALNATNNFSQPEALNAISGKLGGLTDEQVARICTETSGTLSWLAEAASKDSPKALNMISGKLGGLTEEQIATICTQTPWTLENLAAAASKVSREALDAISGKLGGLTDEQVAEICVKAPRTLVNLAEAAYNDFPEALNAISGKLDTLTEEQVANICTEAPWTLENLAAAASNGFPEALNAVSGKLPELTDEQVATLGRLIRVSQHIRKEGCHPIDLFIVRHFTDFSSSLFKALGDEIYKAKIEALKLFLAAPNNVEVLKVCSDAYPDVYLFLAESTEVGDRADGPAVKQSLLEASRSERLNRGEMIFSAVADYLLVETFLKDTSKEKCARCEASYDSLKSALNSMSSLMVYFNKSQAEMENDIADKLGAMLGVYKSQLKVDKRFVQAFIENPPESFEDFKRVILGDRMAPGMFFSAGQSVEGSSVAGSTLPYKQQAI